MNKSETIGNLATALSLLQGEIQDVYKDKKGYGYMYADLSSVLDVSRPLCLKHGLAVSQVCWNPPSAIGVDVESIGVETILMHNSGEWISSTMYMKIEIPIGKSGKPSMSAAQAAGSVITYARRYALAAILGIAQTDDDASNKTPPTPPVDNSKERLLLRARLSKLIEDAKLQDKIEGWCNYFNVADLSELSYDQLLTLITTIEEKLNAPV
jgi:hypothetical protein